MLVVLIVVANVVLLAVLLLVLRTVVVRLRRRTEAALTPELTGPQRRRATAQSLGLTSRGVTQGRGTGTLVLTDAELIFQQWAGKNHARIPLRDIVAVDTKRSHLGKTVGNRLLHVRWNHATGEEGIAVNVRDLDGWLAELESLGVPVVRS